MGPTSKRKQAKRSPGPSGEDSLNEQYIAPHARKKVREATNRMEPERNHDPANFQRLNTALRPSASRLDDPVRERSAASNMITNQQITDPKKPKRRGHHANPNSLAPGSRIIARHLTVFLPVPCLACQRSSPPSALQDKQASSRRSRMARPTLYGSRRVFSISHEVMSCSRQQSR